MELAQFAERYNVKTRRDECGDLIVPGKAGHIGDGYVDGHLGVCVSMSTKARWTYAKKKFTAAGLTIRQDGDTEGVTSFDSSNKAQARIALKVASVKIRRRAAAPSPAQIAAREAFTQARRAKTTESAQIAPTLC